MTSADEIFDAIRALLPDGVFLEHQRVEGTRDLVVGVLYLQGRGTPVMNLFLYPGQLDVFLEGRVSIDLDIYPGVDLKSSTDFQLLAILLRHLYEHGYAEHPRGRTTSVARLDLTSGPLIMKHSGESVKARPQGSVRFEAWRERIGNQPEVT